LRSELDVTPVRTCAALTTAMPLRPVASSFWKVSNAVCSSCTKMTGAVPSLSAPTVLDSASLTSSCRRQRCQRARRVPLV
jgi:hypothetical protein